MSGLSSQTLAAQLKRVESSRFFQIVVISIIILSAITIGAKTYDLPPLLSQALSVMDYAITYFFLAEILIRFAVCENKKRFFRDGWNLFDTLVVVGSLIPLDNADAVFWIGEGLEPWLEGSLEALAGDAHVIELLEADGTTTLAFREGATFEAHSHDHEDHDDDHAHDHEHEHGHDEFESPGQGAVATDRQFVGTCPQTHHRVGGKAV